jgi:hypothetical protein
LVEEYFRKLENPYQLMPDEPLESLPLRFVPSTTRQMRDLSEMIARFGDGEPAAAAFPAHDEPAPAKTAPAAEPEDNLPMGDEHPALRGKIQTVSLKEGKSKKGPWSLWGIKINDEWVNTFSNAIGKMAQANKGQEVTLYFEADGDRKKAVELVLADGTRHKTED